VGAVCDELLERRAIEGIVHDAVVRRLREQIENHVDAVLGWAWTTKLSTLTVLAKQGDLYLTTQEAAEVASCSERTIRRALDSGKLPAYYVGADRRVRVGDLHDHLAKKTQVGSGGGQ